MTLRWIFLCFFGAVSSLSIAGASARMLGGDFIVIGLFLHGVMIGLWIAWVIYEMTLPLDAPTPPEDDAPKREGMADASKKLLRRDAAPVRRLRGRS